MKNEKKEKNWNLSATIYRLRAAWEDRRIGGGSMEEIRPSRFRAQGAEATQSSDYRCLDYLRKRIRLTPQDVFVDVGCGEGRVLTYLYLRKFKGKLIGVELDPDVAEEARRRTANCPNIHICCGNILECHDLVAEATVYYLFNPFNGKIFSKFIAMLEKEVTHPIRLVYLFDYYGPYLDGRPGWTKEWEGTIPRRGGEAAHGSIYALDPQELSHNRR
jgi:SAM-dependent methyltransferase